MVDRTQKAIQGYDSKRQNHRGATADLGLLGLVRFDVASILSGVGAKTSRETGIGRIFDDREKSEGGDGKSP